MKFLRKTFIIFALTLVVLNSVKIQSSDKKVQILAEKAQSEVTTSSSNSTATNNTQVNKTENNTNSNITTAYSDNGPKMISPRIEKIKKAPVPTPQFEKVTYVKQISPAGKAALELQSSGEYIKFNIVLNISSC